MKLKNIVLAAAVAVILLGVTGNPAVLYHNRQLEKALGSIDAAQVTLNEVVPFDWDTVYTFAPYATREEIEQIIGFESSAIRESVNEGMVQLLFVKDDAVTASVCGYEENLGYRVSFADSVDYQDDVTFAVQKNGSTVVLTEN